MAGFVLWFFLKKEKYFKDATLFWKFLIAGFKVKQLKSLELRPFIC